MTYTTDLDTAFKEKIKRSPALWSLEMAMVFHPPLNITLGLTSSPETKRRAGQTLPEAPHSRVTIRWNSSPCHVQTMEVMPAINQCIASTISMINSKEINRIHNPSKLASLGCLITSWQRVLLLDAPSNQTGYLSSQPYPWSLPNEHILSCKHTNIRYQSHTNLALINSKQVDLWWCLPVDKDYFYWVHRASKYVCLSILSQSRHGPRNADIWGHRPRVAPSRHDFHLNVVTAAAFWWPAATLINSMILRRFWRRG